VGEYFDFVSIQPEKNQASSLSRSLPEIKPSIFSLPAKVIDGRNCEKRKIQTAKKATLLSSVGM